MSEHGKRQRIADGEVSNHYVTNCWCGVGRHEPGPSSDPADVERREMRAADEHALHAYKIVRGCPLCEDWLAERRRRIEETGE